MSIFPVAPSGVSVCLLSQGLRLGLMSEAALGSVVRTSSSRMGFEGSQVRWRHWTPTHAHSGDPLALRPHTHKFTINLEDLLFASQLLRTPCCSSIGGAGRVGVTLYFAELGNSCRQHTSKIPGHGGDNLEEWVRMAWETQPSLPAMKTWTHQPTWVYVRLLPGSFKIITSFLHTRTRH